MSVMKNLKSKFNISIKDIQKIKKSFHSEMKKGLSGKKSSLKMIPTHVENPKGTEKGKFLALDLGGTNFRVMSLKLKGKRKYSTSHVKKFSLTEKHMKGKGKDLFDFIASAIKNFIKKEGMSEREKHNVGFTFSFPVKKKSLSSGILIKWTKGFKASGVEGKDVIKLLNEALSRKNLLNTQIVALCNDTVSTLVAKGYENRNCDVGLILGTGTNACYLEKVSNIKKYKGRKTSSGSMIVNMEWGGFDKLAITSFDKELDKTSINPGHQRLEKMVSGMYLGRLTGFVIKDLISKGVIFAGKNTTFFRNPRNLKSEYISEIQKDKTKDLTKISKLLKRFKISYSQYSDRKVLQDVCKMVVKRAARIAAAAIISVVTKIDPKFSKKHTIAVDGSVYEKHADFKKELTKAIKEFLGNKSRRITLSLVKDASGKGAAVIAANG